LSFTHLHSLFLRILYQILKVVMLQYLFMICIFLCFILTRLDEWNSSFWFGIKEKKTTYNIFHKLVKMTVSFYTVKRKKRRRERWEKRRKKKKKEMNKNNRKKTGWVIRCEMQKWTWRYTQYRLERLLWKIN
jgi:hypothetical protein